MGEPNLSYLGEAIHGKNKVKTTIQKTDETRLIFVSFASCCTICISFVCLFLILT